MATTTKSRNSGETGFPPARPPRPANLTVPNLISASFTRRPGADASTEQEKLLAASGISFHRTERATKFTYNTETGQWSMEAARIRIAKEWFSEGGMRQSYRAALIDLNGVGVTNMVVKLFKDENTKPAVVFHEALTQAVAAKYAIQFNNLCERKGLILRITFLPVWVLHLTERSRIVDGVMQDTYATMEPFLPGNYVKLSDNSGRHLDDIPAQAAQTFSHYSFLASGRRLVCVDIQGVSELQGNEGGFTAKNLTLTDPQIHSLDGNMFGAGNLGVGGINAFITSYKRTMFDEQLGLAHLGPAMQISSKAAAQTVPVLPPVAETPPFDTAELASRLSEDEREAKGEEHDAVTLITPPTKSLDELINPVNESNSRYRSNNRERHSQRLQQFSLGGDIHRISMVARSYTMSFTEEVTDEQIKQIV